MALYLSCVLCGRKQADGLLSRGYWGHFESDSHGVLRACPTCKEQHSSDLENRLLAAVSGGAGTAQPAFGVGQSSYR